jgi:hypothetical protein
MTHSSNYPYEPSANGAVALVALLITHDTLRSADIIAIKDRENFLPSQ